jgi:hypothetical protein
MDFLNKHVGPFCSFLFPFLIRPLRPTGLVAGLILFFSLRLNPHHGKSFFEHLREFDFLGLFLIVGGVLCLLLGFTRSENGCGCCNIVLRPSSSSTRECTCNDCVARCRMLYFNHGWNIRRVDQALSHHPTAPISGTFDRSTSILCSHRIRPALQA